MTIGFLFWYLMKAEIVMHKADLTQTESIPKDFHILRVEYAECTGSKRWEY